MQGCIGRRSRLIVQKTCTVILGFLSVKNLGMVNAASKPFQVFENILIWISHLKCVPSQRYWPFFFPGGGRTLSFWIKDKRATSCLLWLITSNLLYNLCLASFALESVLTIKKRV